MSHWTKDAMIDCSVCDGVFGGLSDVAGVVDDEDGVGMTAGANDVAIGRGIPALVRTATTDELIDAAAADDCSALAGHPDPDDGT